MASRRDEQWAMDFLHDTLAGSTSIRILTVIDLFPRECIGLVAGRTVSGGQVATILGEAGRIRGQLPETIRVDNGTEVHVEGPRPLGVLERREAGLQPAGEAGGQCLCRVVQRKP